MDWRPKNSTPSLEDSFASLCRFRTGLRTPNDLFRPKELFSTLCGHPRNRVRQQHDISLGGMLSEALGGSRRLSEALGGSSASACTEKCLGLALTSALAPSAECVTALHQCSVDCSKLLCLLAAAGFPSGTCFIVNNIAIHKSFVE